MSARAARYNLSRLLYLYLGISAIYLLSSSGRISGRDALAMFKVTINLAESASLSSEPCDPGEGIPQCVPGINGQRYAVFGFLPSLMAVPGYELARFAAFETRMPAPIAGGVLVSAISALVAAAIPVVIAQWITLMGFSWEAAVLTALAIAFGTPSWHYGVKGFNSEPYMALMLVLSAVLLLHASSRGALILAGLFLGLACSARLAAVIAVPIYAVVFALRVRRMRGGAAKLLLFLVPTGSVLALLGQLNYLHFGSYFRTGYQTVAPQMAVYFSVPIMDGLKAYLAGEDMSLFLFAPLLLLVPWGVARLYRTHPLDTLLCAGTFLLNSMFFCKFVQYHPVAEYGPRYLVPVLPLALVPLCTVFHRRLETPAWARVIVYALVAASLGVNVAGNIYPVARQYQMNAWTEARGGKSRGFLSTISGDMSSVLSASLHAEPPATVSSPLLNDAGHDERLNPSDYATFEAFVQSYPNPINLETADLWWIKAGVLSRERFLYGALAMVLLIAGVLFVTASLRVANGRDPALAQ